MHLLVVIYSGTRAVMAPLNVNCGTVLIYLCKDNELRVSHASPTGYSQVNNENACSRQPAKSSTKTLISSYVYFV
ncbi:hypothetical protein NC653_037556 [Populus alba x Populus x berolinensis]|uniref:Uncharacterized protein n=1 Tax=Populus alba x Populus x berolinensis TaxID=444605 RepID=A0AAD6LET5_9ROSI|nr:hypothetical protein NC653_037556 [Populus alba x Populus x berolinensis]